MAQRMTSVAGNWSRKHAEGFSLLEMLIVILVIGILYSLAGSMLTLSVADPLNDAAERLRGRVLLALDESMVRSQPLALGFSTQGYAFFTQNAQGQWEQVKQDSLFGAHQLSRNLTQSVYLQGQAVVLPKQSSIKPQVFILPSGEMTAFAWRLRSSDAREVGFQFDSSGRLGGLDP